MKQQRKQNKNDYYLIKMQNARLSIRKLKIKCTQTAIYFYNINLREEKDICYTS